MAKNTVEQRKRAFAEHVASGKSATESARLAGYSGTDAGLGTQASRLLKRVEVQQMVSEAAEKASKVRIFDAAARREILRKIAEGEIEQEIVTTGGNFVEPQIQKRKPTSAERKAAIEHLDKLDGLMIEKREITGKDGAPLHAMLTAIPEEAIRERLALLREKKGKK